MYRKTFYRDIESKILQCIHLIVRLIANFYFCNVDFLHTDTLFISHAVSLNSVNAAPPAIVKYTRLKSSFTLSSCLFLKGEGEESKKILRLKRLENCPNGRAA